jgi:hypothetical protein
MSWHHKTVPRDQVKQRNHQSAYWKRNREYYEQKKEEYKTATRLKIQEYKLANPCPCGEIDPVCLVFHHQDPTLKEIEIANAVRGGWSWTRILTEIEKCKVLCMNCHAKHHANVAGSARG